MATPETLQTSIKFARAKLSSSTVFRKVDRSDRMCSIWVSCNCGGEFSSFVLASPVKLATLSQDSFIMSEEGRRLPISRVEGSAGSTEVMMKVKRYAASSRQAVSVLPILISVVKGPKEQEKTVDNIHDGLRRSMGGFDPRAAT